jgi:hypothetical protein
MFTYWDPQGKAEPSEAMDNVDTDAAKLFLLLWLHLFLFHDRERGDVHY